MILARRVFAHRADLLAALVYGCLAFLSFSALSDYANAHHLFPLPYGGWAFAVAIDGSVLYAFISFKRAPWLAGTLLVSGAAATYTLQRWHAQGAPHPLMVAGVVPALMVLVTFAWHRIKAAEAKAFRPTWPVDYPVPEPVPEPEPEPVPEPLSTAARERPSGNGTGIAKKDMVALDRAKKDPAKVEQIVVERGLDRSAVAARPERWPLPSRNGNGS